MDRSPTPIRDRELHYGIVWVYEYRSLKSGVSSERLKDLLILAGFPNVSPDPGEFLPNRIRVGFG